MIVLDHATVAAHLPPDRCIELVREAMVALSQGRTRQLLRSILFLPEGEALGVMPGALDGESFGTKIVSVFPGNFAKGLPGHQGVVLLFEPVTGRPICIADATEITAARTAAASAAATDALARQDSKTLAILGYGEQAWRHALAIPLVRRIESLRAWGRSPQKTRAFCERVSKATGVSASATSSAAEAADGADIVCTTTGAEHPILLSGDVADGTHLNVVGSSRAGPSEIDAKLVARARFFADHRDSVLAQGAEFLNAKAQGLVDDGHVLGEIGQVFAGAVAGRTSASEVTIYKSLGSIVQDLVCAQDLWRRAEAEGFGQVVSL